MTLATLNFIHSILEHEVETRKNAKRLAFQAWEKAEAEGADNAPALKEMVDKTRASWSEAGRALDDFEAQEWR